MKTKHLITSILLFTLSIAALPSFAAAQTDAFTDVPSTHPNYEAISNLRFNGVIGGYPDGTFKPDQAVNRVEVLKMIFEGLDVEEPETSSTNPPFTDVDLSAWYGDYLKRAYAVGMVEGYADGTFKPDQTVNVVENLKLILEAAVVELPETVVTDPYADTPKTEWYAKYVQYAKDANLIDADSQNKIYPAKGMTRGDFAEALYRLRTVMQQGLDEFKDDEEVVDDQFGLNVRIEDFDFMPDAMTVAKGTKVIWTNYDSSTHTVTFDDEDWDSGNLQENESWSMTFNELGNFDYHCDLHPEMTGSIEVKPANEVPTI